MKKIKIFSFISLFLILFLALSSCGSDIVEGPQGPKGEDGNGIVSIDKTSSNGLIDTYTITFSDGKTQTFDITNGEIGNSGLSAYEIYIKYNQDYNKTEEEWLDDLINGKLSNKNLYTINYVVDGNIYDSNEIEFGHKAKKPEDPVKVGYTFDGWYLEDEKWSFIGYIVTEDLTLNARWIVNNYNLLLDVNNDKAGSVVGAGNYEYNSIVVIQALTNPGYTFEGWYKNNEFVSIDSSYQFNMPADNITFEARWSINSNTTYKVEHYQQNLLNDGYTLVDTDYLEGPTEFLTNAVAKDYGNYTALDFEQEEISSDTVIKIYYDKVEQDSIDYVAEELKLNLISNKEIIFRNIKTEYSGYIVLYISNENNLSLKQLLKKDGIQIEKFEASPYGNQSIKFNIDDINPNWYLYYFVTNNNMTKLDETTVYKKEIKYNDINTKEEFNQLARKGYIDELNPSDYFVIYNLTTYLDYENNSWNLYTNSLDSFTGLFYGNNHKISNIKANEISNSIKDSANIFYRIDGGSIYNITFENIDLGNNSSDGHRRVGVVGAAIDSHIENVKVINSSFRGYESVGAIVGQIAGGINEIIRCELINNEDSKISVFNRYAGGIVGNVQMYNDKSYLTLDVNNCSVIASIGELNEEGTTGIDAGGAHGGIIGRIKNDFDCYNVTVNNCFYSGIIISNGLYNGGLIGSS